MFQIIILNRKPPHKSCINETEKTTSYFPMKHRKARKRNAFSNVLQIFTDKCIIATY